MYFSKDGYIKKIPSTMSKDETKYKYYGGKWRKDDYVVQKLVFNNLDNVLVFTNLGRVLLLKGYDIPDMSSLNNTGHNLNEQLKLYKNKTSTDQHERAIKIITLTNSQYEKSNFEFLFVTKNGLVKRTLGENFKGINKGGLIAIKINSGDELKNVIPIKLNSKSNLLLVTKKGYGAKFSLEEVPVLLRTTKGVIGISLQEGDEIISSIINNSKDIIIITKHGNCKVLSNDSMTVQKRGNKGRLLFKFNKTTDFIINVSQLKDMIKVITTQTFISKSTKYFGNAEDKASLPTQFIILDKNDFVLNFIVE